MTGDRTQGFFHQYANDFDAIYSNRGGVVDGLLNRLFRKSMKLRFIKSVEGCQPIEGKSVLDVGCGPGHYSITLAQRGARQVVGLDFADGMLGIAARHAADAGVSERCRFEVGDFLAYDPPKRFDYVIVMGFMDYMQDPRTVIRKVLSLTGSKAFFSFPAAGGILAWQRKLRYKKRCDLFLYTEAQLRELFGSFPEVKTSIEPIARDFFVTMQPLPAVTAQSAR
jgi:SAM-dependent methyltransferase